MRRDFRLCIRHQVLLVMTFIGTFWDLSGEAYHREGRRLLSRAKRCDRCQYPNLKKS